MKKILIVLAVMALPQIVGLSTLCDARVYCTSDPTKDGQCASEGLMCGPYSSGNTCQSVQNLALTTAARKQPPQQLGWRCECAARPTP